MNVKLTTKQVEFINKVIRRRELIVCSTKRFVLYSSLCAPELQQQDRGFALGLRLKVQGPCRFATVVVSCSCTTVILGRQQRRLEYAVSQCVCEEVYDNRQISFSFGRPIVSGSELERWKLVLREYCSAQRRKVEGPALISLNTSEGRVQVLKDFVFPTVENPKSGVCQNCQVVNARIVRFGKKEVFIANISCESGLVCFEIWQLIRARQDQSLQMM